MRHISEIQDRESLRYVIRHELKDFGIKLPKSKEKKNTGRQLPGKSGSTIFGRSLSEVTVVMINEEYGEMVPKFVVDCIMFLDNHLQTEGLFRKPGSQARQRELQRRLESNEPIPEDAHLTDVASLFKQFFRQLPDPLLTNQLLDLYIKCQQLINLQDREYTTLLLTSTMPQIHMHTLAYVMRFLNRVSSYACHNKMDSANLAVVLAPNFMTKPSQERSDKSMMATDRLVKLQTGVVQLLIDHADRIQTVPESVLEKIYIVSNKSSDATDRLTSEDELDKSIELEAKWRRQGMRKRRSASIHGLVSGLGNRVKSRINGSNENLLKTPGRDEIFSPVTEAPAGVNETPKILRASKRKASDDTLAFSAAKRKAMLQKMTVDPRFSKPGLNLHRTATGRNQCNSPITPLRLPHLSLEEVDGIITQQGETLNFQTPSIKFADESFTSFSATPADHNCATKLSYNTPRKKKAKKLNPLSVKKKRRSIVNGSSTGTGSSTGNGSSTPQAPHTPKAMYRSIKRKLAHKSTNYNQVVQSPRKVVGYRLANEPCPDGLDTLKFDHAVLEQAISLRRTPAFRQKHRRTPSSPALLVTNPFVTQFDIPIDDSPCNVTLSNDMFSNVSLMNDSSPRVVVVDLKFDPQAQIFVGQSGKVSTRKAPCKTKRSRDLTPVSSPMHAAQAKSSNKTPVNLRRSSQTHVSMSNLKQADEKGTTTASSTKLTPVSRLTSLNSGLLPETMVSSISQQSISSILSQVSVGSVKSTFSIERCEEPTWRSDEMLRTLTLPEVSCANLAEVADEKPAALGSMPKYSEQLENSSASRTHTKEKAVSVDSVDSTVLSDVDSESVLRRWSLTKSGSVDSGKGASIDDLAAMEVPVYKTPNGFTLEADSSTGTETKKLQQMFLSGTSSPLVKSLSASDINSHPYKGNPYASTPTRLTRSQIFPVPHHDDKSIVQANIQLFNAMSYPSFSSVSAKKVFDKNSTGGTPLARSSSNASAEHSRRRYFSDDERYKRKSDSGLVPPVYMVRSTSAESGLSQKYDRLPNITEKSPGNTLSITPLKISNTAQESHDLNNLYEAVLLKQAKVRRRSSLKVSIRDIRTPRSLRKVLGDHNVTISPLELEKVAKDDYHVDCHSHRNQSLTPIKLAKSTKMRMQGRRKNITMKYSPSGKMSPGKHVKRLKSPGAGLHMPHSQHQECPDGVSNQGTSSRYSQSPSRRYPNSPKNPLTRPSPRIYPRSPAKPVVHLTAKRTPSKMSSTPGHVEKDTEWNV